MSEDKKRIKHLLWLMMEFSINRYLMANTKGRESGGEKADNHINLSMIYVASVKFCDVDDAGQFSSEKGRHLLYMTVHNKTQELTDFMDEFIGFPLEDTRPDYETLAPKFFEEFIRLADLAIEEDKIK